MNDVGFVKFHRKTVHWQWVSDPYVFECFWLLTAMANYKDGNFQDKKIKRGQLATSIRMLSTTFMMNERTIMRCLKCLEESGEIKIKHYPKFSVITICNYDKYQSVVSDTTDSTTRDTTQHTTNTKNKKNSKNSSSYSDSDSKSHQPKKGKKDDGNENGGNMNIWTD